MIVSFNIVFQNPRRVKRFRERVAARAGERGKSCHAFRAGEGPATLGKRYKKAQPCSAAPFCKWKCLCATEVKKFIGYPHRGLAAARQSSSSTNSPRIARSVRVSCHYQNEAGRCTSRTKKYSRSGSDRPHRGLAAARQSSSSTPSPRFARPVRVSCHYQNEAGRCTSRLVLVTPPGLEPGLPP